MTGMQNKTKLWILHGSCCTLHSTPWSLPQTLGEWLDLLGLQGWRTKSMVPDQQRSPLMLWVHSNLMAFHSPVQRDSAAHTNVIAVASNMCLFWWRVQCTVPSFTVMALMEWPSQHDVFGVVGSKSILPSVATRFQVTIVQNRCQRWCWNLGHTEMDKLRWATRVISN